MQLMLTIGVHLEGSGTICLTAFQGLACCDIKGSRNKDKE